MSWVFLLLACSGGSVETPMESIADTGVYDDTPCAPHGSPGIEVAMGDADWGIDGIDIECGIPPQGGAPYSRFRTRIRNLDMHDGGLSRVVVTDAVSGEELGRAEVESGFVCANVGVNANHWVTAEVHVRYDGHTLSELEGREVVVHVEVEGTQTVTEVGSGVIRVLGGTG